MGGACSPGAIMNTYRGRLLSAAAVDIGHKSRVTVVDTGLFEDRVVRVVL